MSGSVPSVAKNIAAVLARVADASSRAGRAHPARLVAVSKTKPVELLKEAYDAGQRDFGENYVQELLDKVPLLPSDIRWRFIGHLQSNKAKALCNGTPSLVAVETVDSSKLANLLNTAWAGTPQGAQRRLDVFVQVNTSGEETKHGVEPADAPALAKHVLEACPRLRFAGLMTIGQPDYTSTPANFQCLLDCRAAVCAATGLVVDDVELSMGMSGDFEAAIGMGSTNVRVGSTIFGAREYPNAAAGA